MGPDEDRNSMLFAGFRPAAVDRRIYAVDGSLNDAKSCTTSSVALCRKGILFSEGIEGTPADLLQGLGSGIGGRHWKRSPVCGEQTRFESPLVARLSIGGATASRHVSEQRAALCATCLIANASSIEAYEGHILPGPELRTRDGRGSRSSGLSPRGTVQG